MEILSIAVIGGTLITLTVTANLICWGVRTVVK